MDKNEVMAMCNSSLDSNLNITNQLGIGDYTAWNWWTEHYYPSIIRESYPVYIQDRAQDKGKQAFEIIKHLQDKKLMKLDTVRDFIEAMDTLLKVL